jgi:MerR family transcriptional regulator, light-induced transcriptional regulator
LQDGRPGGKLAAMPTLADLPDLPQFPIRVASLRTGIPAVTVRAWERRYQLLTPRRSTGNYRLYSERDLGILRWVKGRVDEGLPIRQAAAELDAMRRAGRWPPAPPAATGIPGGRRPLPPAVLSRRLYEALVTLNEARAAKLLRAASASLDAETVCLAVLQPCLVAIGAAWHKGEIRIATEHFASQLLRGHVMALFQAAPTHRGAARVVVGCAPQERHEIGALMLALFLRNAGYHVEFLGADVHLADLLAYARTERPDLICLSANAETTALALRPLQDQLAGLSPAPRFGFGGAAFNRRPELRERVPGLFLGPGPSDAVARIRALLPARSR